MPVSLKGELRSKRSAALPDETGGSLMGMIDFERRRIDVVGALAPPADSVGTTGSFTRGVSKLKVDIEAAASRAGNQIRYIGEWHSHPEGISFGAKQDGSSPDPATEARDGDRGLQRYQ